MDLRSLEQFVAVAEELHFGRAAARLHMAQPPLSQAIQRLEARLSLQLFERSQRRVQLTDAGRYLLDEARRLLAQAEALDHSLGAVARGEAGEIRVGYNAPAIHGFLARELRRFRADQPGIRLNLRELTSDEQLLALRQQRLHVGFLRWFGEAVDGLEAQRVFRERYVLVIPEDHVLAKKARVALKDLHTVEMIRFPRDSAPSYQDWLLQTIRDAGLEPRVCLEATSGYANVALVSAGLGVAFAPESMTRWPYPGVVVRPLADPLPEIHTHMVWSAQAASPAVLRFLEYIRQRAEQTQCFRSRRR